MIEGTVWKATTGSGENCHFGHEPTARAWAGKNGTVETVKYRMPAVVQTNALERELATARGLASSHGDEDALDEAGNELAQLRQIEAAAETAFGLLWMIDSEPGTKRFAAKQALGSVLNKEAKKRGIKAAIDAGHEADHPQGADWWAGMKTHNA